MKGAGGTEGDLKMFDLGVILLGAGAWMFVDSVNVGTHHGIISRLNASLYLTDVLLIT